MEIPNRQAEIDALTRKYLTDSEPEPNGHRRPYTGNAVAPELSDEAVIGLCRKAKNAVKFSALYDTGDTSAYDGDDSRADQALASILAFYTQYDLQLERLFDGSALGQRSKWKNRPEYRRRTIKKALDGLRETYTQPHSRKSQGKAQYEPEPESPNGKADSEAPAPKNRAQADRLVDYALASGAERFVDQTGQPHALVDGEAVSLGTGCYRWLRSLMWNKENIAVGSDALKTASGMLAALTVNEGKMHELHTRAAFHEGAVYYQLGRGRVVEIDCDNWRMVDDPPVVFRSVRNLKPLPDPKRGGSLDGVEKWANLKTDRDKRLFRAYLITVALAHVARPILQITGTQGSGKTTLNRLVKRLLDPTTPETVRPDPRDFLQKASHAYIVMLDNQNSLPEWAVDTICRLVTGEGDSKRVLYSDDEDFVYELKRAVLLNGINPPADRGDAQDRTLPVELERITNRKRRSEAEIWAEFDDLHPKLLGAVFGALSRALKAKEGLQLDERPRLADWGEYAAAVYEAEGWSEDGKKGTSLFLEDWGGVVKVQNQAALDGSSVAQATIAFMEGRDKYTGKASELHGALEGVAESLKIAVKRDKTWPKSPSWLWRRMKEVLPVIMVAGIEASSTGNGYTGTFITLRKNGPDKRPDDQGPDDQGPDPGSNPGSKPGSSGGDATRENPDTYGDAGSTGSKVAFPGYIGGPLSRTREDKESESAQTGPYKAQPTKDSRNATSATSATSIEQNSPASTSRRLSADEVQEVQRLKADGWSAAAARAEVLGGEGL